MEVAQGAEAYRGEDVFTGADGSPLSVEVSLAPVVIDGEGAGAVLVFQDIGERLRRERMKDDYLAFASHELRSPLTSVIGMAKWLAKHVGDGRAELDDDARDAMETLEGEADRMASIVELFLDLSRIESDRVALELDQVDLRELIDEEAISFAARHPEVRLETACPEGPLAVVSDRVRIRQVVTNLLENAAKYGGDPPRAATSLTPEGAHAVIRVSDNGRGIPPDEQPHIFERFYRGSTADEGSKKGLGVGLFISSEIVHRLGGRITFRTGAKGTEFSVSLPLGEATQPAALRPAGGRQG
jgi:signal transduction histidine kinase